MSNWMNEDGEPYMDGAALRFEAALDEYDAWERANDPDLFDDDFGAYDRFWGDPESCKRAGEHGDDSDEQDDGTWECSRCGGKVDPPEGWDD